MQPRPEPAAKIHRRRQHDGAPIDDRRLRAAIETGKYIHVIPGSYAQADQWQALKDIDRHYLRVVEATDRARHPLLVSHFAAAAVWGIDILGQWPRTIDTIVSRTTGGRSSGVFRRRTRMILDAATVSWRGHQITTPAQTALDLARVSTFTRAVVVLDQALWARRPGGALVAAHELDPSRRAYRSRRGDRRVEEAVAFAESLSDSVKESQSRVLIAKLGFPTPVLQQRFDLPSGRIAYADFFWPEHDHAGEFDGTGKYVDPELLGDRTSEDALLDEKDRGDELRRAVGQLSRWRTPATKDPRLLYDILAGDGLPSRLPRPAAGLVWR